MGDAVVEHAEQRGPAGPDQAASDCIAGQAPDIYQETCGERRTRRAAGHRACGKAEVRRYPRAHAEAVQARREAQDEARDKKGLVEVGQNERYHTDWLFMSLRRGKQSLALDQEVR